MIDARKPINGGIRREGTLASGPVLSSRDREIARKDRRHVHRVIRKRTVESGGLLSLSNTLAQARFMIREMKAQGPIARESAAALARCLKTVRAEITRIRKAHGAKSPELLRVNALLYDAIALGFTLAYLRVERADDRKPDKRKRTTRAAYWKAHAVARNRIDLMYLLRFKSMPSLRKFERDQLGRGSTETK